MTILSEWLEKTERRSGQQAAAATGGSAAPEPCRHGKRSRRRMVARARLLLACSKATKRNSRCASLFTRAAPAGVST